MIYFYRSDFFVVASIGKDLYKIFQLKNLFCHEITRAINLNYAISCIQQKFTTVFHDYPPNNLEFCKGPECRTYSKNVTVSSICESGGPSRA